MSFVVVPAEVFLVDDFDGDDLLKKIEAAGRTCYKSESLITIDSARAFVHKLIANGHESVLEHVNITFKIVCDRGVSHELVRHRIASYSQESTRYVDYQKHGIEFVDIRRHMTPAQFEVWCKAMDSAERAYSRLRELGASPQIARSVLPNSLKTEVIMTCNLREWRLILGLRCSPQAHPQMRDVARLVLEKLHAIVPVVFDDLYDKYVDKVTHMT